MDSGEIFLIVFGSILAVIGIFLFALFVWFKKTILGHSSMKLLGIEVSLSHPSLFIFAVGSILIMIPFLFPSAPPIQQMPIDESIESDYFWWSTQAFFLGYDLLDLMTWGILAVMAETNSEREEAEEAYRGMRYAFLQKVKMFDIDIDTYIPPEVEWGDETAVIDFFSDVDNELGWKIPAIDPIYYQPYMCGRWTKLVYITVALNQYGEPEIIKERIGDLIERFDTDIRGFQDLEIGDDIKLEFESLYLDLVSLSRIASIEGDDFSRIADRTDKIKELIEKEAY